MSGHVLSAVSLAAPAAMKYQTFLAGLGDRDRASMQRQQEIHKATVGTASAQRWRRLACTLRALATAPMKLAGSSAMQFFIPDGKYRKQVFALQALAGGAFAIYAPDVLAEALEAGLLSGHGPAEDENTYHLPGSDEALTIDALTVNTPSPDAFYKDLTGWNRRAMRMTLPASPGEGRVNAVLQLCALAAAQWSGRQSP